ncbi:hypothetical protein ACGFKZ_29490 [Micromonospora tulbaghiae]|uniref:hypothetical protein n=1 Tax=Micromonospora tulbaghiae TaxID=479978 RepID=UPI00371B7426
MNTPTQTVHPWRATLRTVFAATVALLTLLPVAAAAGGVDTVPAVAQLLAITGAVTRVLALPAVDEFLRAFVPWLASTPDAPPASAPRDYPY